MQIKNNEIFIRKKEYPKIDNFVVIYVAVVLFLQTLLQISPFVSFLATTPLYSIQTYLGLLGGGLLVVDLFTNKRVWQGKYIVFLLAILLFALLASDKMIAYGLKENLYKFCWMAIQFCLVYSCAFRIPKEQLEEQVKTLFYALLIIWCFACGISFVHYITQYSYQEVVNPLAQDTSVNWQGFHNNRLYGIFYTVNHAAYVSLFFAMIAATCMMGEKRIWVKFLLGVAQLLLIVYIVLSGSRSALVALLTCALVAGGLAIRYKLKIGSYWKILAFVFVILLVIALCCAAYLGIKAGLAQLPRVADTTELENILDRPDEQEVTNGRFRIWADYISLHKEIGLTGLSPGNYMPYILENHPELFVVRAAKRFNPDKYNSGIIYHVHSGYLMVYVSAGLLGALALAAFMVLCIIQLIRKILKSKKVNSWFVCAILMVVAGAVSAVFDEGLFFQNNPQTTMFWFALGLLMSDCLTDTETTDFS